MKYVYAKLTDAISDGMIGWMALDGWLDGGRCSGGPGSGCVAALHGTRHGTVRACPPWVVGGLGRGERLRQKITRQWRPPMLEPEEREVPRKGNEGTCQGF